MVWHLRPCASREAFEERLSRDCLRVFSARHRGEEIPAGARDALLSASDDQSDDERLKAMSVTADPVIAILERRNEQLLVEERITRPNVGQRLLEGSPSPRGLANASPFEESVLRSIGSGGVLLCGPGQDHGGDCPHPVEGTRGCGSRRSWANGEETNQHYITRPAVMRQLTGWTSPRCRRDPRPRAAYP